MWIQRQTTDTYEIENSYYHNKVYLEREKELTATMGHEQNELS